MTVYYGTLGPKDGNPGCGSLPCEVDPVKQDYNLKTVGQLSGICVKTG